jgi:hypothetical protein
MVDLLGVGARPARVGDAALVDDDRGAAPAGEPQQRSEIPWEPRRPEVEEREVLGAVWKALRKPLEFARAPGDRIARGWDDVMTVKDANAGSGPPGEQEASPPSGGAGVTPGASAINSYD